MQTDYDSENTEKEENLTDSNQDNSECTTPTASHDQLLITDLVYDPVPIEPSNTEIKNINVVNSSVTPTNDASKENIIPDPLNSSGDNSGSVTTEENASVVEEQKISIIDSNTDTSNTSIKDIDNQLSNLSSPDGLQNADKKIESAPGESQDQSQIECPIEENSSQSNQIPVSVIQSSSDSIKLNQTNEINTENSEINQNVKPTDSATSETLPGVSNVEDKEIVSDQVESKKPMRKISRFVVSPVVPKSEDIKTDTSDEPLLKSMPSLDVPPVSTVPSSVSYSEALKTDPKKFSKFKVSKVREDSLDISPHLKMNGNVENLATIVTDKASPQQPENIIKDPVNGPLSIATSLPNSAPLIDSQKRPTPTLTPQASQIINITNQLPQSAINFFNSQNVSNLNSQMLNYQIQANHLAAEQLQPNYMAPLQVSISNQLGTFSTQPILAPNQMAALNNQLINNNLNIVNADQNLGIGQKPMMSNENLSRMLFQQNLRE